MYPLSCNLFNIDCSHCGVPKNNILELFNNPIIIVYFITSFIIGSIPFVLILSNISGYGDIRKIGSGNIGATNVLRTGNKLLAIITLFLDVSKSFIILYIVYLLDLNEIAKAFLLVVLNKTY